MAGLEDFYSWAERRAAADAAMEELRCRARDVPHQSAGPGSGDSRTLDGAEALRLLGSPLPGVVEFTHYYGDES